MHPKTQILHPRTQILHPRTQILHPRTQRLFPRTQLLHPRTQLLHPRTQRLHHTTSGHYRIRVNMIIQIAFLMLINFLCCSHRTLEIIGADTCMHAVFNQIMTQTFTSFLILLAWPFKDIIPHQLSSQPDILNNTTSAEQPTGHTQ